MTLCLAAAWLGVAVLHAQGTQPATQAATQPATRPAAGARDTAPPRPHVRPAMPPAAAVPVHQPAGPPWRDPGALLRAIGSSALELRPETLAWIAAAVVLVLLVQSRPRLGWYNADALVLAVMGLLLVARTASGLAGDEAALRAARWWATVLLAACIAYWSARGVHAALAQAHNVREPNLATRGLVVLVLVVVLLIGRHLATTTLDASSIDGILGGRVVLEQGHLPYGDVPGHDRHNPWLYALHAGALKLAALAGGHVGPDRAPSTDDELIIAKLVNALLVALLLLGMYRIGRRLHSPAIGLTLVAALAVFPGTTACLTRVDVLVPAVLLVWAAAGALLPGLGSLISSALIVMTAFAWLPALLLLPVVWAYWLRQRWHAVGATVGWLVAAAACLLGLAVWTAPGLPRGNGSLRAAGLVPRFVAREVQQQTAIIEKADAAQPPATGLAGLPWRWLLEQDRLHLATASTRPALPSGVDRSRVLYRDIAATGPARIILQGDYRRAASAQPLTVRLALALRTWLEATTLTSGPGPASGWQVLAGGPAPGASWRVARRVVAGLVVLLTLLVALVLLRRRKPGSLGLLGGALAVVGMALLVSNGGVADLVLWAPLALGVTAGGATRVAAEPAPSATTESPIRAALRPVPPGPAPRISVER